MRRRERLIEARGGRTIAEVSSATGLTLTRIADLEECRAAPMPEEVRSLAAFYGVPLDLALVECTSDYSGECKACKTLADVGLTAKCETHREPGATTAFGELAGAPGTPLPPYLRPDPGCHVCEELGHACDLHRGQVINSRGVCHYCGYAGDPLKSRETVSPKSDLVRHPAHYTQGIECWDYITSHGLGFLEGNVIKYVTRYKKKNGLEDLLKARQYLERLIKEQGGTPLTEF